MAQKRHDQGDRGLSEKRTAGRKQGGDGGEVPGLGGAGVMVPLTDPANNGHGDAVRGAIVILVLCMRNLRYSDAHVERPMWK